MCTLLPSESCQPGLCSHNVTQSKVGILPFFFKYTMLVKKRATVLVGHLFEVIHICKDLNLFEKFFKNTIYYEPIYSGRKRCN